VRVFNLKVHAMFLERLSLNRSDHMLSRSGGITLRSCRRHIRDHHQASWEGRTAVQPIPSTFLLERQNVRKSMGKKDLFKGLPPTFILEAHYESEELNQLRKNLEVNGCQVTSSIFHAELVITKLTQEKRIRRDINEVIKKQSSGNVASTKTMDVVKERWIRKCIEEGELLDWPFVDDSWRIVHIPSFVPITPPKRPRSPETFALPGEPASKRRTLSRSGSLSQQRPSVVSAPSFESASSDDPTSKHFHPPSQTSTISSEGEEDDKFDYRDIYSCRRKSPLISRNEAFVSILVEIKLARELAL
jgi:hypothetical protein